MSSSGAAASLRRGASSRWWDALAVLACAACPEQTERSDAALEYCRTLCERLGSCSPDSPVQVCLSTCYDNPYRDNTSEQVYAFQADCLAAAPCTAIIDESALESCFEGGLDAVIPSDACFDFCLEDAATAYECGGGYSVAACLDGDVCGWSDAVLSRAADCNLPPVDCEARNACQAGVFGQ